MALIDIVIDTLEKEGEDLTNEKALTGTEKVTAVKAKIDAYTKAKMGLIRQGQLSYGPKVQWLNVQKKAL